MKIIKIFKSNSSYFAKIKSEVKEESNLPIFGRKFPLNRKVRKLILDPQQSVLDSKYTPHIIKRYLEASTNISYLSNSTSISTTYVKNSNLSSNNDSIGSKTMEVVTRLKKSTTTPEQELLEQINKIIFLESLYEVDHQFRDLLIINFNVDNLRNVIVELKTQGIKDKIDSFITRLMELNDIYNFPFNDMITLLEVSGDLDTTKNYILKEYVRNDNNLTVLKKLYSISNKYGLYLIELWCLEQFKRAGLEEYYQKLIEFQYVLDTLGMNYRKLTSFEELLSFKVSDAIPLSAYICVHIVENNLSELQKESSTFDPSKLIVVGMHQGTGGSPQKAMRLASYINLYSNKDVTYISPSLTPNNTARRNEELINSNTKTIVLDDNEIKINKLEYKFDSKLLELLHPRYRKNSIIKFIEVFSELNPYSVHIIGTLELEIQAAVAAMIVGIPKIILNPGMMNPTEYAVTSQNLLECNFNKYVLNKLIKYINIELYNNSKVAAKSFDNWLGINPKNKRHRTKVLYNGINIPDKTSIANDVEIKEVRQQLNLSPDDFVIGIVGRLAYEKLPFNILEAINLIVKSRQDIKFVFVGDGSLRRSMEEYIESHGISANVSIFGFTSRMDLLYRTMNLCLLVSLAEGMPNVLLEAQSHGVPVITSDVGGCRETILDNVTGTTLSNNEPHTIAKTITSLIDNKIFMSEAPIKAKRWIENNFSMEHMADNTLRIHNNRYNSN